MSTNTDQEKRNAILAAAKTYHKAVKTQSVSSVIETIKKAKCSVTNNNSTSGGDKS